jgi:hypothetical protein
MYLKEFEKALSKCFTFCQNYSIYIPILPRNKGNQINKN